MKYPPVWHQGANGIVSRTWIYYVSILYCIMYLSWHVKQVLCVSVPLCHCVSVSLCHCVSGTAKSTQTQCIGLLSWDKVHFCKSTTNAFTTNQGVDTEKLVDGIILVRNAVFHVMSFITDYQLFAKRSALYVWSESCTKPSTLVLLLSRYRVFTVPRPKDQKEEDMFHRT